MWCSGDMDLMLEHRRGRLEKAGRMGPVASTGNSGENGDRSGRRASYRRRRRNLSRRVSARAPATRERGRRERRPQCGQEGGTGRWVG